jgi:pimeloyl-ACP methyl ester carboxylesterase
MLQEKLIFFPRRLDERHDFNFGIPFEELYIEAKDGNRLHGLLFKAGNSKGLIFYLHGNAGSLDGWGGVAETYVRLQYDVFLLDYRGYGKSEGTIASEAQLVQDVQSAYDHVLPSYNERDVIVLGYSIGSGPAAKLAATNAPGMLILQAPYYSLTDVMKQTVPFLPPFLLKYKLQTSEAILACKMPIVLFHGDRDEVIPYSQSLKLKKILKSGDTLITLPGVGHNGMTEHPAYVRAIERIVGDGAN